MADFLAWCEAHAVPSIAAVQPLHVAAWIELQTQERSALTVKQQLAAIDVSTPIGLRDRALIALMVASVPRWP